MFHVEQSRRRAKTVDNFSAAIARLTCLDHANGLRPIYSVCPGIPTDPSALQLFHVEHLIR